jgi:hypothetical protein
MMQFGGNVSGLSRDCPVLGETSTIQLYGRFAEALFSQRRVS